MIDKKDRDILRGLAAQVAEIAALPVQEEKRALWRSLNARKPGRPMVMIDQVCWNEINVGDELTLHCTDRKAKNYEQHLRCTLFQWRHFPVDMVVEPYVYVGKAVRNTGFGLSAKKETAATDPTSDVLSHKFTNQFETEEDLEKIKMPVISHDAAETERRLDFAHEVFDGLLTVRPWGEDPYLSLWDPISLWMGVEPALYAMVDKPDYMHRLVGRLTDGYLHMLDQLEAQSLLCEPQSLIHCTGAYTDDDKGSLDVRPGPDVLNGLARDVQGVRG